MYEVTNGEDDGDEPGGDGSRWRRMARPRRVAVALGLLLASMTVGAWVSSVGSDRDSRVNAVVDTGRPSTSALGPVELDDSAPSSTTGTTSTVSTTGAPAQAAPTDDSTRTPGTSTPTTTVAVEEPSWEIFLHDVSVSPATASPGETVTVSWRLVSDIGIDQTFFYLSWPESSPGFPAPPTNAPTSPSPSRCQEPTATAPTGSPAGSRPTRRLRRTG